MKRIEMAKLKIKASFILKLNLNDKIKDLKFDVDKTMITKIKRPNIELSFMNDGDFVVNQQEND